VALMAGPDTTVTARRGKVTCGDARRSKRALPSLGHRRAAAVGGHDAGRGRRAGWLSYVLAENLDEAARRAVSLALP
jgi:hypothetical protein